MEEELREIELTSDERELLKELLSDATELSELGESRRNFLKNVSATTAAILAAHVLARHELLAYEPAENAKFAVSEAEALSIKLRVNGVEKALQIEPRVTLLDALRERLELTGSKK